MFGFTCLIKADTDLVKRCLQESKNDVELLTALYDEVLDTDTDAEGMWPTEELATPVEGVFSYLWLPRSKRAHLLCRGYAKACSILCYRGSKSRIEAVE